MKQYMSNEDFIEKSKALVSEYEADLTKEQDGTVHPFDVFVVWNCYTLGNIKALLSTTNENGMYYEVTYNADHGEIYFDAYKKVKNALHIV